MGEGEKCVYNQQYPLNRLFLLTPAPATDIVELKKLDWLRQTHKCENQREKMEVLCFC